MCDITRKNFDELLPKMLELIKAADFIAIDSEFTSLHSDGYKPSLFDSGAERYNKLRMSTSELVPCQLGISIFLANKNSPVKYESFTYNIYLCPEAFGPIDPRFICQASSLKFLRRYNFDFNKFIYEGVSFLNEPQETLLRNHLLSGDMFAGIDRNVDEEELQKCCSSITEWSVNAQVGEHVIIEIPVGLSEYVLIGEIRQRFNDIWPSIHDEKVFVEKIKEEDRNKFESQEKTKEVDEQNKILNRILGVTKIIRGMIQAKKPLVGHNCLMDLLLIYDKFYKPLPESYEDFKYEFHSMFPAVYDTKHISFTLRKQFRDKGVLEKTGLGDLYEALVSDVDSHRVLYCPFIEHGAGFEKYSDGHCPHEAGYDSYMAGVVFLQVCHLFSTQDVKSSQAEPVPFKKYLSRMKPFCNKINVIRAAVNSIALSQQDPISIRPEWLYIKSKTSQKKLCSKELAGLLSSYGTVDIRLKGDYEGFVAASNLRCSKDILRAFTSHDWMKISKYNKWIHCVYIRGLLKIGAITSGVLVTSALISCLMDS
ncbi:poly(A)-specific ribonuclease PNLDC1-like [Tubulanus polymorphus]|uniref:poly(A)-specific ribonuclease PNLDC1-like n=1 Tax=Tubulanus polymorphus TaxID=672921 RepID=UPI003DA3D032